MAPLYRKIIGLGKFYWQETKTRAARGKTGSQDLMGVMMQTEDAKRGLAFSMKEMWLEVFLSGGVGESLPLLFDLCGQHLHDRTQAQQQWAPSSAPHSAYSSTPQQN